MADYSRDFRIAYSEEHDSCSIGFRCFDTPNVVTVYGVAAACCDVEELLLAVRAECLDLHRLWSFTMEGSDIWRINQPCECVEVDARTASILLAMKEFHEIEPAFDFTVGPVSYLWKHAKRLPSDEEIKAALEHVGVDRVSVDGNAIAKADPLVQVDVGGAAKGFAADAIAARLRRAGVVSADIDLGGNLFMVGGHPSGRPWRVAIRIPEGVGAEKPVLGVWDRSVVTSGSYERFVEIGGERFQHIVDSSTGRPSTSDLVSATVVADCSLMADMLATTALLTGSAGLANLAKRHPSYSIVAITDQGMILQY